MFPYCLYSIFLKDSIARLSLPSESSKKQRSRMTTELIQLTNNAEAVVEVTVISVVPLADSGTSVTRVEDPRPTPRNTGRAGRWTRRVLFRRLFVVILSVIIVTPFPNVAVHVIQPKRVGSFLTNLVSILLINIQCISIVPSVITKYLLIVAKTPSRLGSCPAGVVPFSFCW